MKYQDLSTFTLPKHFRGRPAWFVQLWWIVQSSLFRWSPQFAYGFRRSLLRLFGANIGHKVIIRPSATITYPWKVTIGDYSWVGDDVVLYSLGEIEIGNHSVISQRSYLCTGDHDHTINDFPIRGRKISIGSEVWVASDVFIAPDVSIGEGSVIGARSTVLTDLPAHMLCVGYPARPLRPRLIKEVRQSPSRT